MFADFINSKSNTSTSTDCLKIKAGRLDWLTSEKVLFKKLYIAHLSNLGMFATSFESLASEAPWLKLHRHSRFFKAARSPTTNLLKACKINII